LAGVLRGCDDDGPCDAVDAGLRDLPGDHRGHHLELHPVHRRGRHLDAHPERQLLRRERSNVDHRRGGPQSRDERGRLVELVHQRDQLVFRRDHPYLVAAEWACHSWNVVAVEAESACPMRSAADVGLGPQLRERQERHLQYRVLQTRECQALQHRAGVEAQMCEQKPRAPSRELRLQVDAEQREHLGLRGLCPHHGEVQA